MRILRLLLKTLISLAVVAGMVRVGLREQPPDVGCRAADWPAGAGYRLPVRVPLSLRSDIELTSFPVPLTVAPTEREFWKYAKRGEDVWFADCAGQPMAHEVEFFDTRQRSMVAWVQMPKVGKGVSPVFFMYYGRERTVPPPNPWDANFGLVMHMSAPVRDSSTFNRPVKARVAARAFEPGLMGQARVFSGTDPVSVALASTTVLGDRDWTMEFFVKLKAVPTTPMDIFSRGGLGFNFYLHPENFLVMELNRGALSYDSSFSGTALSPGAWTYVCLVRKGGILTLWLNDRQYASAGKALDQFSIDTVGSLIFGAGPYPGFVGTIDEFRLSPGVVRSVEWRALTQATLIPNYFSFAGVDQPWTR